MRRHRLLRTSSAQSLCIFCAFRLSGHTAPAATSQRRTLQTSGRPNQQATAQVSQQETPSEKPQWSFDADDTLSPSEAREKAHRDRIRRGEEEQDAAERLRLQREDERKREERQIQQLQRQEAAQKTRKWDLEARRLESEKLRRRRDRNATQQMSQRPSQQQGRQKKEREEQLHPFAYKSVKIGRDRGTEAQTGSNVKDVGQHSEISARDSFRKVDRDHTQSHFDERARRPRVSARPDLQMPSFGGETQTQEEAGGWGSGNVDIKPVQYKTDEQIQEAKSEEAAREKQERLARIEENERLAEEERQQAEESRRQAERRRQQSEGDRRKAREGREKQRYQFAESKEPQPEGSQPSRYADPVTQDPVRSPPPRQSSRAREPEIESEYQAMPFNSTDYQLRSAQTLDASVENTWQHLGPRKESRPPPSAAPRQQATESAAQTKAFPLDDDYTINRNFEQHRRQRDMRASSPLSNPNITDSQDMPPPEFTRRRSRELTRCARCLQPGHHASECPTPMTCHRCGEQGHIARECRAPAPRKRGVRDQAQARPESQVSRALGMGEGRNAFRRAMSEPAEGWKNDRRAQCGRAQQRLEDSRVRFRRYDSESREETANVRRERSSSDQRAVDFQKDRSKLEARPDRGWAGVDREVEQDDPEEEADLERRMRRRRNRGFADPQEQADEDETPKAYDRRRDGRKRRESEEDADDEAMAAREERAAKKAARRAQEKEEQEKKKAARASGQRAGGGEQVHLPEFVSVSNLAQQLGVGYEPFVERLEQLGYDDVFPGKVLNKETSGMIAMEYDFDPVYETTSAAGAKSEEEERDLKPAPEVEDTTFLPTRPPVVTIMGHVDHGKTTILDYLRRTSVAAGEAGGITQHIGAFSVPLSSSGRTITFLDTPGHAAFMSMRQRGANVTDIVILVVAADDSVKPQTLESIRCAREAGVPMIVAVNKVDKEEADVQRVKNDLARHGVEIEDFGGEVQVVEVSGKTGQGLDALEENIVTLSEILDHRSETQGAVEGWVLEATTKRAGRVATVLVRRGTLRPGAVLVAGKTWARVRTLRDERDQTVMEVGPGMPVEVDGWRDQPIAGDEVLQAPSEQKATDVVEYRLEKGDRIKMEEDMEAINESRRAEQERRKAAEQAARAAASAAAAEESGDTSSAPVATSEPQQEHATGQQVIPFIIKADVSGSAEAVAAYIPSLTSPLIRPDILTSTVGAINESDVELASASNGHIIAFNLPRNEEMRGLAESKGVKVLENNIIYRTLEQVKEMLEAKLPPVVTQKVVGEAEVGMVFEIGVGGRKKMKIAGCKVRNGVVGKNARARVFRGGEKVYDGVISSLKNVKKDVQEMRKGTECGMGFENWEAFQEGDQIQTYEELSEKRKL